MIYTDNLELLPMKREYLKGNYEKWMLDPRVTEFNSHGLFPKSESAMEAFIKSWEKDLVFAVFVIDSCYKQSERHIGNVSLQNINWINGSAEFACIFGETDYWGKGYATEAARALFKHGFEKLGLYRIWTGTAATNLGMRKVAEKVGMKKEGCFRDAMWLDGDFVDVISFGVLRHEFIEKFVDNGEGSIVKKEELIGKMITDKTIINSFVSDCICGGGVSPVGSCGCSYIEKQEFLKNKSLEKISIIRTENNKNWMKILDLAFDEVPEKAKEIMKKIVDNDKQITLECEVLCESETEKPK